MQLFFIFLLIVAGFFIATFQTKIIIKYLNIKWRWIMFVLTPLSMIICFNISDKVGAISFTVHFCSIFISDSIMNLLVNHSDSQKANKSKMQKQYKNEKQVDVEQKTMTVSEKVSLYAPHIFEILIKTYAIGLIFYYIFNTNVMHTKSRSAYNFLIDDFNFQIISIIVPFVISFILIVSKMVYKKRAFDLIYNETRTKTLSPAAQKACNFIFASVIGLALTFLAYIILPIKSIFEYIGNAAHTGFTFGGLNICFIAAFIFNIVMFLLYPIKMVRKSRRQLSNMINAFAFSVPISIGAVLLLILLKEIFNVDAEIPIVIFWGFNIILLLIEILDIKKEKATFTKEGRTIKN